MRKNDETKKRKKEGNMEIWKRQDIVAWKMMNLARCQLVSRSRNEFSSGASLHSESVVGSEIGIYARITREFEKIIDESSKDGCSELMRENPL